MRRWLTILAMLLIAFSMAAPASAQSHSGKPHKARKAATQKKKRKKNPQQKKKALQKKKGAKGNKKGTITVPVDIGIAPAFNWFTGQIANDQFFHYGLKLELGAIIDQKTIKANKHRIPKKYRGMATKMKEFTYRPFWWLPDSLLISPDVLGKGKGYMYGITFRPVGFGMSLLDTGFMKFSISAGVVLTYAYMGNDEWISSHGYDSNSMHFLRPGADAKAELLLKFSKVFLVSLGWDSHFYIPQTLGRDFWEKVGDNLTRDSVWHNGQAYLMLHFRFPYTTKL